jgi:hypothetical protein
VILFFRLSINLGHSLYRGPFFLKVLKAIMRNRIRNFDVTSCTSLFCSFSVHFLLITQRNKNYHVRTLFKMAWQYRLSQKEPVVKWQNPWLCVILEWLTGVTWSEYSCWDNPLWLTQPLTHLGPKTHGLGQFQRHVPFWDTPYINFHLRDFINPLCDWNMCRSQETEWSQLIYPEVIMCYKILCRQITMFLFTGLLWLILCSYV